MSFESPLWLLTLLVLPVSLALVLWLRHRGPKFAVPYPNLDVLVAVSMRRDAWRSAVPAALGALALAALGMAMARPHMTLRVPDEKAMVILVLDTSRSMQSVDVRPSRLEAAKSAAKLFLDRVPARLRVGLVTFSGEVYVSAVPTKDHERVRQSITAIDPFASFGGGTAIGDALARAVEVAQEALAGDGEFAGAAPAKPPDGEGIVSILFLSDGRQNRGILAPLAGAARAKEASFPVHTVALGTNGAGQAGQGYGAGGLGFGRTRAPDPATLRAIAEATGGEFTHARSAKAVSAAYAQLGSRIGRVKKRTEVTAAFVATGAVALLAAALSGAWWSPRLP